MVAAVASLVTLTLAVLFSNLWYRKFRGDDATRDSARWLFSRHTKFCLVAVGFGLVISSGLILASGPELAYLGVMVLVFSLIWPALGAAGNLLAVGEEWPRRLKPLPWVKVIALAAALTAAGQVMRVAVTWQPTQQIAEIAGSVSRGGVVSALCFFAFMLLMAVYEEMIFRHFLLPWMRRTFRSWTGEATATAFAVVANCALFALWHADMMDPAWMKPAQTFIYGLGFCWARILYGSRAAIAAHVALNALVIISTILMTGVAAMGSG